MTSRFLVTPPTQEPLTIWEIERHLRLDASNKELPPDAPTAALAGAGAGSVDNGAHRYVVTFLTADGETTGGPASAPVTVADKTVNGKVALSGLSLGGAFVTSRRLYRTTAGGSSYFLVATIADNTSTTFTDNVADASLGAGVPVLNTTLDPELLGIQKVARSRIEERVGRSFLTQVWRYTLDGFPGSAWWQYGVGGLAPFPYVSAFPYLGDPLAYSQDPDALDVINLPRPPLQSVSSITYVDPSGNQQTLSASVYAVDTDNDPGRVVLKYGQSWPATQLQRNAVVVNFTAGYSSPANVPDRWKQALKLYISHLWENRETRGPEGPLPAENIWDLMSPESISLA